MKIETTVPSHAGHPVKYSGSIVVTYDSKGIAEVSEEDGEDLIEKYKGLIYPAGQVPKPAMVRSVPTTSGKDNETVAELKISLQKANRLVGDHKASADVAKNGEKMWRDKCDELMTEIKGLKAQLAGKPAEDAPKEEVKELSAEEKIEADLAALTAKLEAKTVKELQAFAVELNLPIEEYSKLNKAKLVEYLVEKTNA
jgi:tartrate dehydratase beta subunit/fumarate hydratase class I family protein